MKENNNNQLSKPQTLRWQIMLSFLFLWKMHTKYREWLSNVNRNGYFLEQSPAQEKHQEKLSGVSGRRRGEEVCGGRSRRLCHWDTNEGDNEVLKMMQLENQVVNTYKSNAIYVEGQIFVFLNIFSVWDKN